MLDAYVGKDDLELDTELLIQIEMYNDSGNWNRWSISFRLIIVYHLVEFRWWRLWKLQLSEEWAKPW